MSEPKTEPLCELMLCVVAFAEAHRRIPVGEWTTELEPGFRLRVNGTDTKRDSLPPWTAMITNGDGFPLFVFDAYGGEALGCDPKAEDNAIAMLKRCTSVVKASKEAAR